MTQAVPNARYFELAYPVEPWEYGAVNLARPHVDGMVKAPDGNGRDVVIGWDTIEATASQRISLGPESVHA